MSKPCEMIIQGPYRLPPVCLRFVLESMCRMGYIEDAVRRVRQRYMEMADSPDSTLWEDFHFFGTHNHAWSGAPMVVLSRYVAGICLDDMHKGILRIQPSPLSLGMPVINLETAVPTRAGFVALRITEEEDRLHIRLHVPEGLTLQTDFTACVRHGNAPRISMV